MSRLLQRILRTLPICLPVLNACGSSDESGARNTGGSAGSSGATSAASGGGGAASGGNGGSTMMNSGGTGAMNMAGGSMMDQGGAMAVAGSGNGASTPQMPVIQSVTPMGGLHVVWTNASSNCDKIELLRNKDGGEFTVAYTLTGAATSQHDAQVSAPGTFCYKARCVIGNQTSQESAEKCGAP